MVEFLADAYQRAGRGDDAVNLAWQRFERVSNLLEYKLLAKQAQAVGNWPKWREKALAKVRKDYAKAEKDTRRPAWTKPRDRSGLVELLLWDGDVDTAWSEATEGGCAPLIWLRLADARANSHPAEAVVVYQRDVESIIRQTGDTAYKSAIATMNAKIRPLMSTAAFERYVEEIRAAHARKPKFIQLLARTRWRK